LVGSLGGVTDRPFSFSAGPGVLPLPVLEAAQRDLVSLPGLGVSPLEVSHRGPWFTEVLARAEADLGALLALPTTHRIVFCQGGASLQFSMVAMNLLHGAGAPADYVLTGSWGAKALAEATKEGDARAAWSGEDARYVRTPTDDELRAVLDPRAAYVHLTTNETIQGVEYPSPPWTPDGVPLVADVSSDFLSRSLEVSRFGLLYAGAQKNAGPAGVTVVIVREDLLERIPEGLPTMLDYRTYVREGSLYNTPPVFAVWMVGLVAGWLREEIGGLRAMEERNRAKADLLYAAIDDAPGFYTGHAEPGSRSLMNVTWRLPTEDLERTFLSEATEAGLTDLKGHRSVGGIRASIYNAMPLEGCEALAAFMGGFAARHAT
jgi:phosphoserine aminotransferase